jgi:amino acid transporter
MEYKNSREFLEKLGLIFYATVSVPLFLFVITYLRLQSRAGFQPLILDENWVFLMQVVIILLALAAIFFAFFKFRNEIRKTFLLPSLRIRLELYYKASIGQYIYLAIAGMLVLAGIYLTGNNFFVIMYMIILIIISLSRPTAFKINRHLKLNKEEREKILKNEDL